MTLEDYVAELGIGAEYIPEESESSYFFTEVKDEE